MGKTLYDKVWDSHVVHVEADGTTLLYVDRQLPHEVSSAHRIIARGRDRMLMRRTGMLRKLSCAVGVTLGLVGVLYAQSGADAQLLAQPPGSQVELEHPPIVAGRQRQPTAEEIDRQRKERDEDREVEELYHEIMRGTKTEPALRP
jgi:hypothetical protein